MPIFGNNKITQLEQKLTQAQDIINKNTDTIQTLEDMISREKQDSWEFSDITTLYNKLGDPYIYDVTTRKCVDELAKNISQVTIEILNKQGNVVSDTDKVVKLFNHINDEDSLTDFIYEIVRSLSRYGKAFIFLNGANKVPEMMDVLDAKDMKAKIISGKLYKWVYQGKKLFEPEDILFIRYKHPVDPWDGIAPLSSIIKELVLSSSSLIYNIKYFQNGATGRGAWVDPSGAPLTPQQKREADYAVEREWNSGLNGAHKSPVLTRKLEWIRTSDSAKDMDFINLLEKMSDRVMDAFGVPHVLLKSSESTFANLEEAKKLFWNNTLKPIMKLIESSINTHFMLKRDIGYTFRFRYEDITELQDDLNTKLDSALKLYSMNVPLSVINEVLDLQLGEGWEGWDRSSSMPIEEPKTTEVDISKAIDDYIKTSRINEEKSIVNDAFLLDMEYKKSLSALLEGERAISNDVEHFFREKWKEIEKYIELNPPVDEKDITKEWITKFIAFINKFDWGMDFFNSLKDNIEKTFQKGRYRTYWGVGANFNQASENAVDFIMARGLKLTGSPRIVQDTIIEYLSSESFTAAELAKAISSKWKDASLARAKNIAITESTAAYNGGRVVGMKELGIKKKQWVHSHDGKVRDSHRISQVVEVDQAFTLADGVKVMYPGDGDPAHSCNCRCIVLSYLD